MRGIVLMLKDWPNRKIKPVYKLYKGETIQVHLLGASERVSVFGWRPHHVVSPVGIKLDNDQFTFLSYN